MKILRDGIITTNLIPNGSLFGEHNIIMRNATEEVVVDTGLNPIEAGSIFCGAFHRIDGCLSNYIFDAVGSTSGTVTIYDVQQGTSNYKTSSGGAWVDGSGETWEISFVYDQTRAQEGDGTEYGWSIAGTKPILNFNATPAGYPALEHTDTTDGIRFYKRKTLANVVLTWETVGVLNNIANIFIHYKPTGTAPTAAASYSGERLCSDGNYMGLHRTIISGVNAIWAYNWDGSEDKVGATYTADTWHTFAQIHQNSSLAIYKNGTWSGGASSGNTSSLTGNPTISNTSGDSVLNGETGMMVIFNTALSSSEITRLMLYMENH